MRGWSGRITLRGIEPQMRGGIEPLLEILDEISLDAKNDDVVGGCGDAADVFDDEHGLRQVQTLLQRAVRKEVPARLHQALLCQGRGSR